MCREKFKAFPVHQADPGMGVPRRQSARTQSAACNYAVQWRRPANRSSHFVFWPLKASITGASALAKQTTLTGVGDGETDQHNSNEHVGNLKKQATAWRSTYTGLSRCPFPPL